MDIFEAIAVDQEAVEGKTAELWKTSAGCIAD